MNRKNDKCLQVGAIVSLKGKNKRIMITGFLPSYDIDGENSFNYTGSFYPEDFLTGASASSWHPHSERPFHVSVVYFSSLLQYAIHSSSLNALK